MQDHESSHRHCRTRDRFWRGRDRAGATEDEVAVELSDGTKVLSPTLPDLKLTNQQREQIRKAVLTEHNAVEFRLKTAKAAKDFTPEIGAKLPKGVKAQALLRSIRSQIPEVRDYWYVKMKDRVLIVNGMTNKIVDMFSDTQPIS
jgi:hypothetical protein